MSRKRKGPSKPREWQPLRRAQPSDPQLFHRINGPGSQMWINDRYVVSVVILDDERGTAGPMTLSIRRRDRKPVRDWAHCQRIKTQLAGAEREAFELYPAESRLMDTANSYWLWVLPEGQKVEVGWDMGRLATDDQGRVTINGEPVDENELDDEMRSGYTAAMTADPRHAVYLDTEDNDG